MNPMDDQLNRLFRSAQRVPSPEIAPAFGLETRVLAAWRESAGGSSAFWDMAVLVRGLVVAALIAMACFLPAINSISSDSGPFSDVVQLTDSTLPSDDSP
jgi:hypothetical protein